MFRLRHLKELTKYNSAKDSSVEEDWKQFREAVKRSAEVTIGYQTAKKAKKPWVSEKMIEKMEERRSFKNINTEIGKKKYRYLNNELRRETDKAREDWWNNECDELEELDKLGRSDLMYSKVKQITRTENAGTGSSNAIKDKNDKR